MSQPDPQVVKALRYIASALDQVVENLTWPGSEHVGYVVEELKMVIDTMPMESVD